MLRKLIGVLMLILLFGLIFLITACLYSVCGALIMFGAAFALICFIIVAVELITG